MKPVAGRPKTPFLTSVPIARTHSHLLLITQQKTHSSIKKKLIAKLSKRSIFLLHLN